MKREQFMEFFSFNNKPRVHDGEISRLRHRVQKVVEVCMWV